MPPPKVSFFLIYPANPTHVDDGGVINTLVLGTDMTGQTDGARVESQGVGVLRLSVCLDKSRGIIPAAPKRGSITTFAGIGEYSQSPDTPRAETEAIADGRCLASDTRSPRFHSPTRLFFGVGVWHCRPCRRKPVFCVQLGPTR